MWCIICVPIDTTHHSLSCFRSLIIRAKLTDLDTGNVIELQKGDSAVLELGSSVRWEIFETVTKFFVIVKP